MNVVVENISKEYGKVYALKSTSVQIEDGEFFTILGPSGSGKTTLLKMISGFELPTSGKIFLGSNDVTNTPPHKRGIGIVFQSYALFPHMTVFDNISFPLRMRKIPNKKMKEMTMSVLALVQLEGYKDRYPGQLSGGQCQRVALARAVVFNPPLLLLDEPLGALDKQLRLQMQIEIKKLQEQLKITTISVTHDQEEALTMSTRICVVNKGEVEQIGTPREIYDKPKNRFIANFIGETNLLDGQIIGWEEGIAVIKTTKGEILRALSPKKDMTKVAYVIRPENIVLAAQQMGTQNILQGIVEEVVYVGQASRCKVVTSKGETLKVTLGPKEIFSLHEGQEVFLGWEVNEGVLLNN